MSKKAIPKLVIHPDIWNVFFHVYKDQEKIILCSHKKHSSQSHLFHFSCKPKKSDIFKDNYIAGYLWKSFSSKEAMLKFGFIEIDTKKNKEFTKKISEAWF